MDLRLALTGFGNVGQGVAALLIEHGDNLESRYGVRMRLTGVADRGGAVTDAAGLDLPALLAAKKQDGTVAAVVGGRPQLKGEQFLKDAAAQILIEAASTNFEDAEPGWGYIGSALTLDMDLVLASKGALVLHYRDLMARSHHRGRRVMFSATVGAPLPVLELADRMLVGARIGGFEGILNATGNHILTAMAEGASFEEGVRIAQEEGVAETDPTLDVDGWDAAAKVVIIANAVLGADISLHDVAREGIRGITAEHLQAARSRGERIKLVAGAVRRDGAVSARVGPQGRRTDDVLGSLTGGEMGIIFHTDILGAVTSTSLGTGGLSTAWTVLRDIVNLTRDPGWRARPAQ